MSKSERVEPVKSTAFVTTTATVATTTPIPVGETTHFLAITAGLEGDLVTADSQGMPGSCTTPVIRPTPVFQNGNGLPMLKDFHPVTESTDTAESSLEASPTLAEEQGAKQQPEAGAAEEGGEETLEATTEQVLQLDPSGVQEAPAMRPTKLESTQPGDNLETKLENQRRQGKQGLTLLQMLLVPVKQGMSLAHWCDPIRYLELLIELCICDLCFPAEPSLGDS